jgi:hypothetical protein
MNDTEKQYRSLEYGDFMRAITSLKDQLQEQGDLLRKNEGRMSDVQSRLNEQILGHRNLALAVTSIQNQLRDQDDKLTRDVKLIQNQLRDQDENMARVVMSMQDELRALVSIPPQPGPPQGYFVSSERMSVSEPRRVRGGFSR